jgi:hypothetical protein
VSAVHENESLTLIYCWVLNPLAFLRKVRVGQLQLGEELLYICKPQIGFSLSREVTASFVPVVENEVCRSLDNMFWLVFQVSD